MLNRYGGHPGSREINRHGYVLIPTRQGMLAPPGASRAVVGRLDPGIVAPDNRSRTEKLGTGHLLNPIKSLYPDANVAIAWCP
jgi:hypothetical protein